MSNSDKSRGGDERMTKSEVRKTGGPFGFRISVFGFLSDSVILISSFYRSSWHCDLLQDLLNYFGHTESFDLELRTQNEAMFQDGHRHGFDIIGRGKIPAGQGRRSAGSHDQRLGSTRPGA